MEEKDYNEIAKIIKKFNLGRSNVVNELADYFERENKKLLDEKHGGHKIIKDTFNRKQFLKDCGVNQ